MMERMRPLVARHWLFLLAGVMWTGVGLMLLARAWTWLAVMPRPWQVGLLVVSGVAAGLFYWFMFTKTVAKNICRLCRLPDPVSIFAFNSPKGYVLIFFMIGLGIALRHSGLDRRLLAFVYVAMGATLFLASTHFHLQFYRVGVKAEPCLVDEALSSAPCQKEMLD